MIPVTKKEEKIHNKQKVCHVCKKKDLVLVMAKKDSLK